MAFENLIARFESKLDARVAQLEAELGKILGRDSGIHMGSRRCGNSPGSDRRHGRFPAVLSPGAPISSEPAAVGGAGPAPPADAEPTTEPEAP